MSPNLKKLAEKDSTELIVYQVGEVKNLLTSLTIKFDSSMEKIEGRVSALEMWRAGEEEKNRMDVKQPLDIQKIILAAFSLISTVVASALMLNRGK